MLMIRTQWVPGDTNPVHIGQYEVEPKNALANFRDTVIAACWEKRHGQFGFWTIEDTVIDGTVTRRVSTLLDAVRWRGLVRPVITKEGEAYLDSCCCDTKAKVSIIDLPLRVIAKAALEELQSRQAAIKPRPVTAKVPVRVQLSFPI